MKIGAKTYFKTVLLITCFPLTKSDICPQRDSSNRQGKQKAGQSTGHGSSRSRHGGCAPGVEPASSSGPVRGPPAPPTATLPQHHDARLGWGIRGSRAAAPPVPAEKLSRGAHRCHRAGVPRGEPGPLKLTESLRKANQSSKLIIKDVFSKHAYNLTDLTGCEAPEPRGGQETGHRGSALGSGQPGPALGSVTAGRPGSTGSPASARGLVRSSPCPERTQGTRENRTT